MANTAIQNIKILHKRYSTDQWTNGIQVNGQTILPKLAHGEIGLDTTTLEVRIGTNSAAEQTWAQAHVIDAEVAQTATYYHKDGTSSATAKEDEVYVVTSCQLENTSDGKHKMTLVYKSIELVAPKAPDLKVTDVAATTTEGEVSVVANIAEGQEHEIISTKTAVVKKDYVDSRTLSASKSGTGEFITGIKSVVNTNGNHEIVFETADVQIDIPELELVDTASGEYVSGLQVEDHKVTVLRGTLPVGTGSRTAGDLEFIDKVSLDGHTLTATTKGIKGDSNVITVTKDTDGKIKVSADTYTKAEIDAAHEDLAKAMKFKGTLDTTGENGDRTLPSSPKQGDVYKVVHAGTYNSQAAKVGDLFIYDGTKWRFVPSGDETFTDTWRSITVNNGATTVKDSSIGSGAIDFTGGNAISVSASNGTITISHNDTSTVENLTKKSRQYVDGLLFDEYGHVTGYTVGEEVDQFVPSTSGGETAGTLGVISSALMGWDTEGNHVLQTATKTLNASDKINVAENGSVITFKHDTATTSAVADTAKNKTITAGSTDNKFTVVDSLTSDGYGHITEVKTKEITVDIQVPEDTTYEISTVQKSTATGETSADINLTASGGGSGTDTINFKVDAKATTPAEGLQVTVSGDTITLTGKATSELLGMIRAAYSLNSTADTNVSESYLKNFTGNNMDKLYGVNVKQDGTAFVEVPWVDTHVVATNFQANDAAVKNVDMYAFNTDEYGHVENAYAITTIDGNYA